MTPDFKATYFSPEFEAGQAFCHANHGPLADRWQEIGRRQCGETHAELNGRAFDIGYERGYAEGQGTGYHVGYRRGAVLGLGVAFALAVVAGYLGRRR